MNNVLVACMFGAGVSAFAYTRMGRRLGYTNTQNIVITCAVVFVIASIIFFTILATIGSFSK